MRTVKEELNKIKWDKRENPEVYEIGYYDRISQKEIRIKFCEIEKIEEGFIVVRGKFIPLHRIRKIYKKGRLVWERHGMQKKRE